MELTPSQKLFCELYVSEEFFGNGTKSYLEAYKIDVTKPGAYSTAKSCASDNLTKPNLLKYINSLLDEAGLNDVFVDKQLLLIVTQNADFGAKVQGIREYNKLRKRIIEKSESKHTVIMGDLSKFSYEELKDLAGDDPAGSEAGTTPA